MAVPRIPSISLEYLKVAITAPAGVDVDELPVEFAIVDDGEKPTSGDWEDGVWLGTSAAVLIGPGGTITLDPGTYDVYVRLTASPEAPVLLSGSIHIT